MIILCLVAMHWWFQTARMPFVFTRRDDKRTSCPDSKHEMYMIRHYNIIPQLSIRMPIRQQREMGSY